MSRRMISTTVYFTPEQIERLTALSVKTKVPIAVYIRQAAEIVLEKSEAELQAMLAANPARPGLPFRAPRVDEK